MKGKITVLFLIIFTVAFLVFGWFLLQYVIVEYDLEAPDSIINGLH